MLKLTRNQAIKFGRKGLKALNYELPGIENGSSVIYNEATGEHGQRTIGNRARIYYVIEGEGEFIVNGKKFSVAAGDVIPIAPQSTYNYFAGKKTLKLILFMELLDVTKLPR